MSRKMIKNNEPMSTELIQDIKSLIEENRKQVAVTVNAALTMLYWQIGKRINDEALKGKRADYGKQILPALSAKLTMHYGRGWSERNLAYMIRFAEVIPDMEILQTLCAKLSWSHFKTIIYMDDPLKRSFYIEICSLESWSTRTLNKKIDSMLFERTALSKKPDELIEHELKELREENHLTPNLILKDPYILDFLELNDHYLEKDLEDGILREMEQFLLELGAGFSFIARQKRLQIDDDDFYIDLLFYLPFKLGYWKTR